MFCSGDALPTELEPKHTERVDCLDQLDVVRKPKMHRPGIESAMRSEAWGFVDAGMRPGEDACERRQAVAAKVPQPGTLQNPLLFDLRLRSKQKGSMLTALKPLKSPTRLRNCHFGVIKAGSLLR